MEEKDWKKYIIDEKDDENPDKRGWTIKEREPLG